MSDHANFADRLAGAIDRVGSPACIGIDPVLERLPIHIRSAPGREVDQVRTFCLGVLEAIADLVPAIKPQSACFERFGSPGVALLEDLIERARSLGLLVILDGKRGDIGSTGAHYAAAAVGMGADAVTVNAYLGASGVQPFLEAGLGIYIVVRTSNPDSDYLQGEKLASGATVAEHLARLVAELGAARIGASGLSSVGAVVGATKSAADGASLRKIMPDTPMLVPGIGAQGGTMDEVRPLVRAGGGPPSRTGVLVNASRSVLYARVRPGEVWDDAVRRAAESFARDAAGLSVAR
jgi:orotidine-5'-phosphate decarboxylase